MDGWRRWLLTKDNRGKSFGDWILCDGGIAVAEQNDRDIVVRKSVQFCGEARAATFAGHYAMPEAFADVTAVTIAGALDEVLLAREGFQDGVGVQSTVETVEVVDGRVQRAVSRLVRPVEIGRLFVVGDAGGFASRGSQGNDCEASPSCPESCILSGSKMCLRRYPAMALSCDFFQYQRQQIVVGVAVVVAAPRLGL